jgi:hypothetical protein
MTNPADTLTALVANANAGTAPNTPDGVLWHEFAVARTLASAADKRKKAADKAIAAHVNKTLGQHVVYDGAHLTVACKTVETRGQLNEDGLRVAMHKAGLKHETIEQVLQEARGGGSTMTTYTVLFK